MNDLGDAQVMADMKEFTQEAPEAVTLAQKLKERMEAQRKHDEKLLKPEQIKSARKFAEDMKHEDEKEDKAKVLRKIMSYLHTFPHLKERIHLPKAFGAKQSLDELHAVLSDIEHELGKQGGMEILSTLYFSALEFAEEAHHRFNPFGWRLDNLSAFARAQTQNPEKDRITPILAELAIKYDDWFSSSVEKRFILMNLTLFAAVHKMNDPEVKQYQQAATQKAPSKKTREAAGKL